MVLILDGKSEIGAHGRSHLFDLFKEFDLIESGDKSDFPSCVRNMF